MKKTFKDILYNAVYQVFLIILPLLTTPILSRRIGAEGLGIYGYVFSIAQFLITLVAVGMNPFRIRSIAQTKKDKHRMSQQFWNIFLMQLIIGGIVSLIYLASIWLFPVPYKELYLIQYIFVIGLMLDISWFFQGIEEFSKVVIRNTLIKLSSVGLIILFVWSSRDLSLYIFITAITNLLGSLIFWISLKGKVERPSFDRKILNRLWRPGLMILIPQLFMQVYTTLDKTVVGYFVNPTELSYYDQSQKIARIILAVLTSITIVMLPKMSEAQAEGNQQAIITYTKKSFDYTLVISVLLFSVVFVNTISFVPWFFGAAFKPMINNMLLVGLIIIFSPVGSIFSNQFSIAIKKDTAFAYPLIIGAFISVIGNVLIVPKFGSFGGTLVLVLVELTVCGIKIFMVRKELNLTQIFTKNVWLFLVFAIVINGAGYFFLPVATSIILVNLIWKSLLIALLYVPLAILLFPAIRQDLKRFKLKK